MHMVAGLNRSNMTDFHIYAIASVHMQVCAYTHGVGDKHEKQEQTKDDSNTVWLGKGV